MIMEEDDWRIGNIIHDSGKSLIAHCREPPCRNKRPCYGRSPRIGMQTIMNASTRTGMISIGLTMRFLIPGAAPRGAQIVSRPIRRPVKPLTCPPVRLPVCKIA
jgi:hypothetical protein